MPPGNVIRVDAEHPDTAVIARAATLIQNGDVVAFPTETVYGLGANALETEAVAKIFALKGRPATNPVIVHVTGVEQAKSLAAEWPENADKLAAAFWPGPLTIVVRKNERVPEIVTAGGDTVALRMPKHPVALALLNAAGVPIAAPSANRSTELSPTRAEHVAKSFKEIMILDGGPCEVGIESTVVDATGEFVRILRPGMVNETDLQKHVNINNNTVIDAITRSPGLMKKHYSPKSHLILAADENEANRIAEDWGNRGANAQIIRELSASLSPDEYANQLYHVLHEKDQHYDAMILVLPPDIQSWQAIRDRLRRATVEL